MFSRDLPQHCLIHHFCTVTTTTSSFVFSDAEVDAGGLLLGFFSAGVRVKPSSPSNGGGLQSLGVVANDDDTGSSMSNSSSSMSNSSSSSSDAKTDQRSGGVSSGDNSEASLKIPTATSSSSSDGAALDSSFPDGADSSSSARSKSPPFWASEAAVTAAVQGKRKAETSLSPESFSSPPFREC